MGNAANKDSLLSPEHQRLIDTHGVDGTITLKDAAGKKLCVRWSEAGNFIIFNPGGWGDGKFYLTTILFKFLAGKKPSGFCLHEADEGCQQMIPAAEMQKLKQALIKRYTHKK